MAFVLSATCVAIAEASKAGTLKITERSLSDDMARRMAAMGCPTTFIAIEDDKGLIEVSDSMEEANARIAEIKRRVAQ